MDPSGRVVLVTGASSGLGAACARALVARGHRVYAASRSASGPPGGEGPIPLVLDVNDDASVDGAVAALVAREGRLDAVVNSAGVGLAGAVEDTTPEEARAIFETNLFGVHRVCRATLPWLRAQRGVVVNVGSIGGRVAIPFQGFYSASKAALAALTDVLRRELAPFGVRVALVEAGDFRSGFTARRVFAAASGGSSPYADRCRMAVSVMEQDERRGADPEPLARRVADVVEGRARGSRLVWGPFAQRVVARLAAWLPDAWLDRALRVYYG